MRSPILLIASLCASVLAGGLAPAEPIRSPVAPPVAVVVATQDRANDSYSYLPGGDDRYPEGGDKIALQVAEGGRLFLVNPPDTQEHHSVTSYATTGGVPLFDSGWVPPGEYDEVVGVGALEPGNYRFYCQKHPYQMGTLTIS